MEPAADGPSPWTAGLDLRTYSGSVQQLAQALGLKVLARTVNEPADMARLIDARVDGIVSDYPDRLRRGQRPPMLCTARRLSPLRGTR